jgi:hypothetical protein
LQAILPKNFLTTVRKKAALEQMNEISHNFCIKSTEDKLQLLSIGGAKEAVL